jgi:hypothetical protein
VNITTLYDSMTNDYQEEKGVVGPLTLYAQYSDGYACNFTYLPEALSEDVHLKVRIFKEYHSVCPLVGIGTLPTPLSPASVPLPQNGGGGAHSPAGKGLGESQFRRLEKKLITLPTL